jgi:hypothetical protein
VLRIRRLLPGLITCGALALGVPAAGAAGVTSFSSPSTNIGCNIFQGDGHWIARCDIRQRDWSAPQRPRSCRLDYGQGVYISSVGGRARYVCAGDTALGPTRILDYGQSITRGPIKCLSLVIGMRCNDMRTGHGFLLARGAVKLY